MLSRLRPAELKVDFEDRPYNLGEDINVKVELNPRSDVDIREGRVDLVCDERYTQTYDVTVPGAPAGGGAGRPDVGTTMGPDITRKVVKEHKESHVHSSAAFAIDKRLRAGGSDTFDVRLPIQPTSPQQNLEAAADANTDHDVKWSLVTTVNVARGRDPKSRRVVKVLVP